MAVSLSDNDDDDDFSETHDINVTPFIDVILVLLIIFMVAAPLATVDVPINLPTSTATPQKKPDKPTYVSIKSDLTLAVGENPVKRLDLVHSLDGLADMSKDKYVFLRADKSVPYGRVAELIGLVQDAGLTHIGFVAQPAIEQLSGAHNPS